MEDFIYLNNAATSWPKPPGVAEAMSAAIINKPGSAKRGGVERYDVFAEVRKKMGVILGAADYENIALGCNATWALNSAIFGFPFERGDVVVTSKSEHNSVLRPLHELERRGIISAIYLDADKFVAIPADEWERSMRKYNPHLAVFTHASNVTGAVNDAGKLTESAKKAGACVLLDASQTCGLIEIHADAWGADMIAFTGHKYLLGPQGTAGLYVRPELRLEPYLFGGTGSHSELLTMPKELPSHLEAGTGNEPSFHGLLAALKWAEQNPVDMDDLKGKIKALRQGLTDAGADVIIPAGECTPVVSFTVPGQAPHEVGYMLEEGFGIISRTGLHCAAMVFACLGRPEGNVRFSLSRFTTDDEINEAIDAIREIANGI